MLYIYCSFSATKKKKMSDFCILCLKQKSSATHVSPSACIGCIEVCPMSETGSSVLGH